MALVTMCGTGMWLWSLMSLYDPSFQLGQEHAENQAFVLELIMPHLSSRSYT